MLETIQEHAWARLAASGESAAVQAQHAGYFLALAEEAEPMLKGAPQERWLARLESEHDNLRAALAWTQNQRKSRVACGWLVRCGGSGIFGGIIARAARTLPRSCRPGVSRTRPGDPCPDRRPCPRPAWCRGACLGSGRLRHRHSVQPGEPGSASGTQRLAGQANALNTLGLVTRSQGDFPRARALHTESLTLRRSLGNQWGVALPPSARCSTPPAAASAPAPPTRSRSRRALLA